MLHSHQDLGEVIIKLHFIQEMITYLAGFEVCRCKWIIVYATIDKNRLYE